MLTLKNRGAPITPADLDALAANCGAELPEDYRQLMLRENGGEPTYKAFHKIDGDQTIEFTVATVYSVRHDDGGERPTVEWALATMVSENSHIKPGYLPVADDGATGRYCLAIQSSAGTLGAVYLIYMDTSTPPEFIAGSFKTLLNGLKRPQEDEYLY